MAAGEPVKRPHDELYEMVTAHQAGSPYLVTSSRLFSMFGTLWIYQGTQ